MNTNDMTRTILRMLEIATDLENPEIEISNGGYGDIVFVKDNGKQFKITVEEIDNE